MTEPINLALLLIVIAEAGGFLLLCHSPELKIRLGRDLRARGAGQLAAREAWREAYNLSHAEQANADAERAELRKILKNS